MIYKDQFHVSDDCGSLMEDQMDHKREIGNSLQE
jgi:hypothetical protein